MEKLGALMILGAAFLSLPEVSANAQSLTAILTRPSANSCEQHGGCTIPDGSSKPFQIQLIEEARPETGVPLSLGAYQITIVGVGETTGDSFTLSYIPAYEFSVVNIDGSVLADDTYDVQSYMQAP